MARHPQRSIDAIGALLLAALLGVGLWSALLQTTAISRRMRAAQDELADVRTARRAGETAVQRLQSEIAELEAEMQQRGAPVPGSSAEDELHAVASIARQNGLEILSVSPMPAQEYPGLSEVRYALEGRATFSAWTAFLARFEQMPFWGDITQVKMRAERAAPQEAAAPHLVSFTLSLFSAHPPKTGAVDDQRG